MRHRILLFVMKHRTHSISNWIDFNWLSKDILLSFGLHAIIIFDLSLQLLLLDLAGIKIKRRDAFLIWLLQGGDRLQRLLSMELMETTPIYRVPAKRIAHHRKKKKKTFDVYNGKKETRWINEQWLKWKNLFRTPPRKCSTHGTNNFHVIATDNEFSRWHITLLLFHWHVQSIQQNKKKPATCRSIAKWMDMTLMPVHFVRFDSGFRFWFWNSLAPYYVRLKLRMANMTVTIQQANGLRQLNTSSRTKKNRKWFTCWNTSDRSSQCKRNECTTQKRMKQVRSEWDSWISECWRTVVIKCFYRSRCILCVACLFEHKKNTHNKQVFYVCVFCLVINGMSFFFLLLYFIFIWIGCIFFAMKKILYIRHLFVVVVVLSFYFFFGIFTI